MAMRRDLLSWLVLITFAGRLPAAVRGEALKQLKNVARLPITHSHVAAIPNVHFGRGATVGSVITTRGTIIPAAVGVDIKCGMHAVRVDRQASQLPDNLRPILAAIEARVPVGFARRRSRPPVSSATRTPA